MISNNTMEKKNFFAPLSKGLGATRRAATALAQVTRRVTAALALILLLATTAQTARAAEDTTFPLTSGQTWTNTTTNTKYTVSGTAGNLTLMASVADASQNDGKGYIDDYAFHEKDMSGVKSFVIGEGITSINYYIFRSASNLTLSSVSIPASVTSISMYAFGSCTSLSSVTIASGSKLQTIGNNAFQDCAFTSIVLPCAELNSVASGAFNRTSGHQNLTEIVCTSEATLSVAEFVFYNNEGQVTVYMPGSSKVSWGDRAKAVKGMVKSIVKGDGVSTLTVDYSGAETRTAGGTTWYLSGSTVKLDLTSSLTGEGVVFRANGTDLTKDSDGKYVLTLPDDATTVIVTASIPQSISGATVTLAEDNFTFDNTAKEPAVNSVTLAGTTLTAGTDYAVSYEDNTAIGTGKVVITGKGNYVGTVTKEFTIAPPAIGSLTYNSTGGYYEIADLEGFNAFAAYYNSLNTTTCETIGGQLSFRLTQDIGSSANPVGSGITPVSQSFHGTFDGGNHIIHGISISSGESHFGLFRFHYGTICNLTLADATVTGTSVVGGIVGKGPGQIENCHVTGSVRGTGGVVGGIIGSPGSSAVITEESHVKDCTFSGTVTGSIRAGGIVGYVQFSSDTYSYTISGCTVTDATITATNNIGGIVGDVYTGTGETTTTRITGCKVANTTVTANKPRGAIVGQLGVYHGSSVVSGCVYQNVDQTLKGIGMHYEGENQDTGCTRVYAVNCEEGISATLNSGTSETIGGATYYASGTTLTLSGHADREGYVFLGYTATGVTLSGSATSFTMPASDVTIGTEWADPADISVNAAGTEYTIHTAEGWGVFCDCLDDNDTYNRFSGKTVKLGNDIGTAQDPITRMAGSSKHDFCGTFDGDGHTLTVNVSSDSRDYTAPFSYVSTTKADPNDQADSPATIRNLNVAGTVTATKDYAGGIVGAFWGTLTIENCTSSVTINTDNKHAAGFISCARGNATIRNCLSSVTINSTVSGDGTHAGFIGGSSNGVTTTIEDCAFTGSMLGSTTTHCAGFMGYNSGTLTITNSLYAPADDETWVSSDGSATFARGNAPTTTNTYYTRALGTEQGKAAHTVTAGENVTVANAGNATEYNVSGITSYGAGIKYGSNLYAGSGDQVSLTLTNTATGAPEGYQYGYSASAGTLSGTENPYTLTMPDEDVTITVGLSVIDWATESDGDADHPYMIYNKDQLDLLAQRVNGGTVAYDKVIDDDGAYFYCYYSDKYFKLGNDINYSHTSDWNNFTSDENNYEAIGCYYSYGNYRVFNGHFDGAGHTISGIRIYKGGSDDVDSYQGIFGITNSADIHDLTLADACITGYDCVGGIVGVNVGTITRCHVANNVAINSVKDASGHGGIVGCNNGGTVSHCTSAVKLYHELNSDYCLGGIAGGNDGTLTDNLVIGATIPTNTSKAYGAITGGHVGGTLEHNYYTACNVAGTPNATGVGRCLFEPGNKFTIADVTENDGAVPALRDGADNTYALSLFAAIPATLDLGWGAGKYSVQLTGRTLYKDGDWNTLCLPFAMTAEQVAASALAGATLMELDTDAGSYGHVTGLDNGTLYLNFKDATSIEAGKPYLIKWAKANDYVDDNAHNIVNPVFSGVTIDNTDRSVTSSDGYVTFKGTYDRKVWNEESQSILFVGAGNTLYWPQPSNNQTPYLNACRAYFQLNNGLTAAEVSAARMNFEDDATGISDALRLNDKGQMTNDNFYDLQGRKIENPTKGLYIHNGKKVIIK